jgi:hypothetical protein
MTRRIGAAICATVLCLAWPALDGPALAEGTEEPESKRSADGSSESRPAKATRKASKESGSSEVTGLPVFIPPPRGAPKMRIGAASRQPFLTDAPEVHALVPREAGLTIEEQPVLHWYLSKPTNAAMKASLIAVGSRERLLDTTTEGPFAAGVHALRLADFGVRLDLGTTYQWSVAYLAGSAGKSSDFVAGGGIERVEPSEELRSALAAASPARIPFILAEAGIWYEAISNLSSRIDAFPRDAELRYQRAALLEQVGLETLAQQERRAASLQRDYDR